MTNLMHKIKIKIGLSANVLLIMLLLNSCGSPPFPDRLELNRSWHFHYDPDSVGVQQAWFNTGFPINHWETVPGESTWDPEYDGVGWFIQDVRLPELRTNRSIALVVTGVDDMGKIWMNDSLVIPNIVGNNQEFADVTEVYRPNRNNRISIMVRDTGGTGGLTGDVYIQKYVSEQELQ